MGCLWAASGGGGWSRTGGREERQAGTSREGPRMLLGVGL